MSSKSEPILDGQERLPRAISTERRVEARKGQVIRPLGMHSLLIEFSTQLSHVWLLQQAINLLAVPCALSQIGHFSAEDKSLAKPASM